VPKSHWGVSMNSKWSLLILVSTALALASCTGTKSTCTKNCTTGNATVNVTLFDTPPTGVTVLSFTLPIVGISLTPSTGSPVSIYSPTSIIPTEITHLQSDSTVITTGAAVAAGTYTSVNVTLGASSGVFINDSGSSITGGTPSPCPSFAVCQLPNGAATTVSIPVNLTLNPGQNQWIGLDINLSNAIRSPTTTSIGVDFTQAKTFTVNTTARVGIPSGSVDSIADFTGAVTAVSSSSITVQSSMTGQTITAAINSSTVFNSAPNTYSNCTSPTSCIVKGSVVSMDALLTTAGTFVAIELDTLDTTAVDEVEGIIYPTATAGVVGLILFDKTSASGNALLASSVSTTYGTGIFLTANSNINYGVDTKTLTNAITPIGFAGSGDLLAGQQIRAQVTGVTTATSNGTTIIQATATNVILRWSRISGTINTLGGLNFTVTGIPSYINGLNTTLSLTPLVFTYNPGTFFDGVTSTTDANFVVGNSVAIRALYLNNNAPPFQAAAVRVP
jgi:Domain of unknown function (DUF4382)